MFRVSHHGRPAPEPDISCAMNFAHPAFSMARTHLDRLTPSHPDSRIPAYPLSTSPLIHLHPSCVPAMVLKESVQFPLHADDNENFNIGSRCLCCENRVGEVEGFIRLTTGGLANESYRWPRGLRVAEVMDAFFELWYHGPHPITGFSEDGSPIIDMNNRTATMNVVEALPGSQVELEFCSTKCLREFFNRVANHFDTLIDAKR
jgi:hypothetical protein